MNIANLKDLKKLIQLCQAQSVRAIEIDGIKLELNPPAYKPKRFKQVKESDLELPLEARLKIPQMQQPETDELSQEDLLFYSAP